MEEDLWIRRLGRTAAVVCALMTVAAFLISGARAAAGVIGGGILIGVSFVSLASGTGALADIIAGKVRADRARVVRAATVRLVARYALLGFLAYVMIARLRLHPVGLLAGASSIAAAAFVEAVRLLMKKS